MKMRKAQHKALRAYVGVLQAALGRSDWKIDLARRLGGTEDGDGEQAHIIVQHNGHEATIHVSPWLVTKATPAQIRHALVHELLHTYEKHVYDHVIDAFREPSSVDHWNTFDTTHTRLRERMVDQLAFHIAELLPLP